MHRIRGPRQLALASLVARKNRSVTLLQERRLKYVLDANSLK